MRWKLKKTGEFDIWSFYSVLRGHLIVTFPWKGIWGSRPPGGFTFFVWTAALGKILIGDNLRRRGYSLVNWHCMCWCYGESMDHLLIHCEGAYHWWSFFLDHLGLLGFFLRKYSIF